MESTESYGRGTVGEFAATVASYADEASLLSPCVPCLPFVFFDLETTGLSGGAGTCAFLVGCGWFDAEGAFVTRQYLLARTSDERPMLGAVAACLARAGSLVSFNGKSFDAPVLETRYLLHRLDWDRIADRVHLDMLHPARRFWSAAHGPAAGSCSLSSLEEQVLKVRRVGDVSGFEIPSRYFQFIRSGDPRPLAPVLEHNRLDLVSLAGLTARLLRLVVEGPEVAWNARELLALGRAYADAGRAVDARKSFERALELGRGTAIALEALRCLAIGERRARRFDAAADYWSAALALPGCSPQLAREANEALAIHHEHRVRDLGTARNYAMRTLEMGEGRSRNEAARHRVARLDRKLASSSTGLRTGQFDWPV